MMVDNNSAHQNHPNGFDEELTALRSVSSSKGTDAPVIGKKGWTPKTISRTRNKWIIRALMLFLSLLSISEIIYIRNKSSEPYIPDYPGGPPTEMYLIPISGQPIYTPTVSSIHGLSGEVSADPDQGPFYPPPPTPTQEPLPEELAESDLPAPPE